MPEASIVVPDFYPRLNLIPGRELNMFTSRLWEVVGLREEVEQADWDDSWMALDRLYHRHGCSPHPDNFADVIAAEERATEQNGAPDSDLEDYLPPISSFSSFYGFGSAKDGMAFFRWYTQDHIKSLFRYLLDECRRSGSVVVPAHWTPSTMQTDVNNSLWVVEFRDQLACYKGLVTDRYTDMAEFAGTLFAEEAGSWLPEGNGLDWNQEEAREQVALYTWDTAVTYFAQEKYAEAIDSLRILSLLGDHHYRFLRAVKEMLESPEPSIRVAVLEEILRHARWPISNPGLSEKLMAQLAQLGVHETVFSVAAKILYVLRLQGGQASYDALSEIAQSADSSYARDAATRALAWLPRFPQCHQRLAEMARSANRRAARAAHKTLSEIKYHGLFSREGEFASNAEHDLHDTMKQYFVSRGQDEEASRVLDGAFKLGFLRMEVEGLIGHQDCRVSVVTMDDVPLHTEDVYTREYCGLLDRLPSVEILGAELSDEELNQEYVIRRAFGASSILLQGEFRQKVGEILAALDTDDGISVGHAIRDYLGLGEIEMPRVEENTDLSKECQIEAYQQIREALSESNRCAEQLY